jgi:NAD(P)-dependent dehydrogenase (short-subunit alcohol dehydrogenase family)
MSDLSAKTILVTGASKGIGAAIARRLGEDGAYVVAHYGSDRDGAEAATARIPAERKLLVQADLGDLDAVERLWSASASWRGGLDVVVNNAAVMLWGGGIDQPVEAWDATWDETLRVNVLAPARLMRQAIPHFLDRGGGTIISISSWAAQRGVTNPDTMAYGASKAAIRAATQTVARAYAARNILAYIIAPGVVRTRLSQQFAETQGGEAVISAGLASGRWVEPEEIAHTVAFLAAGLAPQLSGATLDMNGASYIR